MSSWSLWELTWTLSMSARDKSICYGRQFFSDINKCYFYDRNFRYLKKLFSVPCFGYQVQCRPRSDTTEHGVWLGFNCLHKIYIIIMTINQPPLKWWMNSCEVSIRRAKVVVLYYGKLCCGPAKNYLIIKNLNISERCNFLSHCY